MFVLIVFVLLLNLINEFEWKPLVLVVAYDCFGMFPSVMFLFFVPIHNFYTIRFRILKGRFGCLRLFMLG